MGTPTIDDPSSMTSQVYDCEAVDLSTTDFTPTVAAFARGLVVGGSGTVKVDALGVGGKGGKTGVTLTLTAGFPLLLAVTKIYKVGTAATGITALY